MIKVTKTEEWQMITVTMTEEWPDPVWSEKGCAVQVESPPGILYAYAYRGTWHDHAQWVPPEVRAAAERVWEANRPLAENEVRADDGSVWTLDGWKLVRGGDCRHLTRGHLTTEILAAWSWGWGSVEISDPTQREKVRAHLRGLERQATDTPDKEQLFTLREAALAILRGEAERAHGNCACLTLSPKGPMGEPPFLALFVEPNLYIPVSCATQRVLAGLEEREAKEWTLTTKRSCHD